MLVGNRWKIEHERTDIVVYKKRSGGRIPKTSTKSTKEYWYAEGFFSTVRGALTFLVNQEVKETELKDFKIVCDKLDELYGLIGRLPNITVSDFKEAPHQKKVLSPEHVAKLQEGRKARKSRSRATPDKPFVGM